MRSGLGVTAVVVLLGVGRPAAAGETEEVGPNLYTSTTVSLDALVGPPFPLPNTQLGQNAESLGLGLRVGYAPRPEFQLNASAARAYLSLDYASAGVSWRPTAGSASITPVLSLAGVVLWATPYTIDHGALLGGLRATAGFQAIFDPGFSLGVEGGIFALVGEAPWPTLVLTVGYAF